MVLSYDREQDFDDDSTGKKTTLEKAKAFDVSDVDFAEKMTAVCATQPYSTTILSSGPSSEQDAFSFAGSASSDEDELTTSDYISFTGVEEKKHKQNVRVLREMRILLKIRMGIFHFVGGVAVFQYF